MQVWTEQINLMQVDWGFKSKTSWVITALHQHLLILRYSVSIHLSLHIFPHCTLKELALICHDLILHKSYKMVTCFHDLFQFYVNYTETQDCLIKMLKLIYIGHQYFLRMLHSGMCDKPQLPTCMEGQLKWIRI